MEPGKERMGGQVFLGLSSVSFQRSIENKLKVGVRDGCGGDGRHAGSWRRAKSMGSRLRQAGRQHDIRVRFCTSLAPSHCRPSGTHGLSEQFIFYDILFEFPLAPGEMTKDLLCVMSCSTLTLVLRPVSTPPPLGPLLLNAVRAITLGCSADLYARAEYPVSLHVFYPRKFPSLPCLPTFQFHLLMQSFFIHRRPLSLRASSLNLTNSQIIITYDTEDLTWQFTSISCPVAFRQAYVS